MYTAPCTLKTVPVQCILYPAQCTLCLVQYTLYLVACAVYIHCEQRVQVHAPVTPSKTPLSHSLNCRQIGQQTKHLVILDLFKYFNRICLFINCISRVSGQPTVSVTARTDYLVPRDPECPGGENNFLTNFR